MKKKIIDYYKSNPLNVILIVALIVRLVSVIFAKGYGMHDDHFLIVETSRSWADGMDFQGWLPSTQGVSAIPQGHSFTYPLIMFCFFKILSFFGISDLNSQMYFIRFIHALFSLLTIFFAYKITLKASKKTFLANIVGWFIALLWCMPWLSVRNLVEITCIPFILWSTYLYIKDETMPIKNVIFSGILMGVAFAFRFQLIFFIGGFGLAMLFYKQWKNAVVWTIFLLLAFSISQISDVFLWHRPFAEMEEYIRYNFTHSQEYITGGFFEYFGVILGVLLPPISVLLLFGFFYGYKKLFLFLPAFCFLFFHSIFPNKQERFIFPIIPSIIILGVIGLNGLLEKYPKQLKLRKIIKVCFIISFVLNVVLLIPVTFHYSKRARVESMVYLHQYKGNVKSFIVDGIPEGSCSVMPRTYLGEDSKQYNIISDTTNIMTQDYKYQPSFVLFVSEQNLEQRKQSIQRRYPHLEYETTIEPSRLDKLMQKINHHNRNFNIIIYRNDDVVKKNKSN